jgi:hypothetical protein
MKAGKRNRREACCDVKRDGTIWKERLSVSKHKRSADQYIVVLKLL